MFTSTLYFQYVANKKQGIECSVVQQKDTLTKVDAIGAKLKGM